LFCILDIARESEKEKERESGKTDQKKPTTLFSSLSLFISLGFSFFNKMKIMKVMNVILLEKK